MNILVERAKHFAIGAHEAIYQRRDYTNEPYWHHPRDVAALVASVSLESETLAAAWLHDVVEDTDVTNATILKLFGCGVASIVYRLTNCSPAHIDRKRKNDVLIGLMRHCGKRVKTVKLADIIDNTATIADRDPDFARVYLREKLDLLAVLKDGDETLWRTAAKNIEAGLKQLKMEGSNDESTQIFNN